MDLNSVRFGWCCNIGWVTSDFLVTPSTIFMLIWGRSWQCSYLIYGLSLRPLVFVQPVAVDRAILFWLSYKNAWEYWTEQRLNLNKEVLAATEQVLEKVNSKYLIITIQEFSLTFKNIFWWFKSVKNEQQDFEFLAGMLLLQRVNGSSRFYKGPRTCKVWISENPLGPWAFKLYLSFDLCKRQNKWKIFFKFVSPIQKTWT